MQVTALKPETKSEAKNYENRTLLQKVLASFLACVSCILLVVGTLLMVEAAFAIGHIGEETVVKPDPLLGYSHLENQSLTYRQEGFSKSKTNSLGFRDREFARAKAPDTTRICVLGDSMTVGMEVPPECTFTRLLEDRLNQQKNGKFEVFNCGISGYGTGQEYLLYRREVKKLNPDIVMLIYNVGDVEDNVFQRNGMHPPRPLFQIDNAVLKSDLSSIKSWFDTNDARFYYSFDWLRRNSRVLAVLSKLDLDLANSDNAYAIVKNVISKPLALVWEKALSLLPAVKASPPETIMQFPIASHLPTATKAGPIPINELQKSFYIEDSKSDVALGIINALNNDCRKNNCKLVVVSGPALTNSIFYYRELNKIARCAEANGFVYIPANKSFPPREPMEQSPLFFGLHFTRAGHSLMADSIARGLALNSCLKADKTRQRSF